MKSTLQDLLEQVTDAVKYAIKQGYTKDQVEFFDLAIAKTKQDETDASMKKEAEDYLRQLLQEAKTHAQAARAIEDRIIASEVKDQTEPIPATRKRLIKKGYPPNLAKQICRRLSAKDDPTNPFDSIR